MIETTMLEAAMKKQFCQQSSSADCDVMMMSERREGGHTEQNDESERNDKLSD